MRWHAIKAVLRQELFVTRSSWETIFDIFIFTLINIVLFGFITTYLVQGTSGNGKLEVQSLMVAVVFWEVIRINQYATSVSSMWNVWSHNLSNMFIAPIRVAEYLLAHILSATGKSLFILLCAIPLSHYIFHVNLLALGAWPILFTYLNMVVFATALGLVLIGLVFQFGTRVQALTWGVIFTIQPLCAVYFPVSVLPVFLQPLSYAFPVTFFFEWLRALHQGVAYSGSRVGAGFALNIAYLAISCWIFSRQLAAAKRSGQLARNDL
ncbi:MAG TPA: ABC transporter permease [Candidatus Saccharimonadales bacterium]|nr:ABC transporter permease [Candidatus Saccharimonadales bacterium]